MVKTSCGTVLERKIWTYIRKTLMKPRKKLGGLPICPFARKYEQQIMVKECSDWHYTSDLACQLLDVLGLEAVVLSGKELPYEKMMRMVSHLNKKYGKRSYKR